MRGSSKLSFTCAAVLVLVLGSMPSIADNASAPPPERIVTALQSFQKLIGEWRGIGQPRRGSNRGAWQEESVAIWQLKTAPQGISWTIDKGKLWKSALLTSADDPKRPFVLTMQVDDDVSRTYRGGLEGERLVLETDADAADEVHRLTLTWLGDDRVLFLFEKRGAEQSFYQRVAEVAYQRQGTRLAAKDGSGPECVVTGGLGTISVSYEGKTYYVCCTGCRDAFNDDPAGILAAWETRRKKGSEAAP